MFEKNSKNLNSDEKYRLWMNQRLEDLKNLMLDYLKNNSAKNPKFKTIKVIAKFYLFNLNLINFILKIACLNGLFDLIKYMTQFKKGW